MSLRRWLPWLALAAIAAFIAWKLRTSNFDWTGLLQSLRTADFGILVLALLVIYLNFVLRAVRWSIFLRPALRAAGLPRVSGHSKISWTSLTGSQFIGFTGLAIFGRIGELIRPLLVARRTGLSFSSQVAVVTVERIFDLGAFALLFSLNLLLSPALKSLPFHERFHMVGYAIGALTLVIAVFVALIRLAGEHIAGSAAHLVSMLSASAGASTAHKILAFSDGLNVIDSIPDFLFAAFLSIALWMTIAASYFLTLRAFPAPVHNLTVAHTLVLMGFSVVGSLVQLPGVGGGAQVATISALTLLFGIPKELAVSAGLMIWLITTMGVIPAGLIFARIEGVSIRQAAESADANESVTA